MIGTARFKPNMAAREQKGATKGDAGGAKDP